MGRKLLVATVVCLLSLCAQGRADFKYSQSSQITGGMMAGMMKFMGHFNKKISQPAATTTYVKGPYLRTDNADGSYRIIDLQGQRMIEVDPAKQTYRVATFEQLRQTVQKMQQAFGQGMHNQPNQPQKNNTRVTATPKIEVNPTGRTQTLLGQTAEEVKTKVAMEIQATDAQKGTQSGSFDTEVDSWIAPSVGGYQEVSEFYRKMATEIGWTPSSLGMDPRMQKAMVQLYKGGKIPQGLPMLQVMSLLSAAQAPPPEGQQQPQQQAQASSGSTPTTPNEAAMKALGGMFGRWHKKKQEQDQQQTDQSGAAASAQPASNALMEITMRVISYSADPLDAALFQIPAGYTEQPADVQRVLAGGRQ
jgi:hypothetical protein